MFRKSFVFTLIVVSFLAVSVYGATAQEPQSTLDGSSPWVDVTGGIAYSGGNVGIGTAAPTRIIQTQTGISQYSYSQTNGTIELATYLNGFFSSGMIGTVSDHPFQIYTSNSGPVVTFSRGGTGGRVGIGTTSPGEKLTVAGVIESTAGGIKFPDGTVQTTASSGGGGGDGNGWSLTGNAGTVSGTNFLGTTDDQALELYVNSSRALRLEPNGQSPNVIGGYSGNTVGESVYGATIGGGGRDNENNVVSDDFATIGGGSDNRAENVWATIGGGFINRALGNWDTVGGGTENTASGGLSTVSGGNNNAATGVESTIGGGSDNNAQGQKSTIGGGKRNTVIGAYGTIAGGGPCDPGNPSDSQNIVLDDYGTIAGGCGNQTEEPFATISGGRQNTANRAWGTVGGGWRNEASLMATVGGGVENKATGQYAVVGGGSNNTASRNFATVPGGQRNAADGQYSFAAGRHAKASHDGTFVWADSTDADFASTARNQFLIRASGNVGIGTNAPERDVHIKSNIPYVRFEDTDGANKWEAGVFGQDTDFRITEIVDDEALDRLIVEEGGNVGIGVFNPQWRLHVDGTTSTDVLHIRAGQDLAEPFQVAGTDEVEPGMVVAIDVEHPGQLRIADKAYDRTVAGVVSGAGGLNPGLIMQQEGAVMAGTHPVALTGRVYVWTDASHGAIQPGDLLTTSDKPGHAMKVTDFAQSQGAILGKAMSKLDTGMGLVLVLVTLQ